MKTMIISFLLFSLFLSNKIVSQETSFEINIVDDSLNILPTKFLNDINGKYIGIVKKATLYNPNGNYYTNYLYRIDENGNYITTEFSKTDTIVDYFDIIRVNVGQPGYLLSGLIQDISKKGELFNIFTRLDTNMNIIWEKIQKFDYTYNGWGMRMMQLKDSSFLYCCTPVFYTEMFLLKLSYYGDSLMFQSYSGDSAGFIRSITYNPDSSAFWLHNSRSYYGLGGELNRCTEINNKLKQTNVFHYPEFFSGLPYTSKLLPSGNLVSSGSTRKYLYNQDKWEKYISVYKFDSAFNIIYGKYLTNPDTSSRAGDIVSVDYYYPSCIYVAGSHNDQGSSGVYPSWYYVTKLDDTLGIEYEKYIGGDDYYKLSSIVATQDGGVLLAGTRAEVNAPLYHRDGYIIKLDSTGCLTNTIENNEIQIKDAIVYPNPGREKLMVRTMLKNCVFQLYEMNGVKVLSQHLENHISDVNVNNIKSGVYVFIIIQNNEIVEKGKWIKK